MNVIGVVDGTGHLYFYRVSDERVDEFIDEAILRGDIVFQVSNGFDKGDEICFSIEDDEEEK